MSFPKLILLARIRKPPFTTSFQWAGRRSIRVNERKVPSNKLPVFFAINLRPNHQVFSNYQRTRDSFSFSKASFFDVSRKKWSIMAIHRTELKKKKKWSTQTLSGIPAFPGWGRPDVKGRLYNRGPRLDRHTHSSSLPHSLRTRGHGL